jgi:signal peptidase I
VNLSGTETREARETHPEKTALLPRAVRILREVVLTLAAVFGLVVSLITLTAARSGVQPLVVRSGSMEPTIATGSMVLTKKVEASSVKKGHIVAVLRPDRTRVTHRVLEMRRKGDAVELILKGDANPDPDPVPVTVRHAGRMVATIPHVGRVMAWLASAKGGFVLGCLVTAYVMRTLHRRADARHG